MNVHFINYAIDISDLVTAITGGIIGALAGGVPAYLLARRQSRELLQRDTEARLKDEKASALTATVKFIQIINSLLTLRRHVEVCFQLRPDENMEPWQRLIPMVGHSDEATIRFNDAEIALLARAREAALMQDLLLLANRHSSAVTSWDIYCQRRDSLVERAPKPTHFEGQQGAVALTEEQVTQLKVYTIPLNNLALSLRAFLATDSELARKIAEALPPAFEKYFETKGFVTLEFPTPDQFQMQVDEEAVEMKGRL